MLGKNNDQGGFMVTPVQSQSGGGNGWTTSLVVVGIIFLIAVATGGEDEAVCEHCVPPGAAEIPADIEYVAPAN
ncbi:MAG: hypothetical protein ABJQ70_09860 [Roseobacter sp.]